MSSPFANQGNEAGCKLWRIEQLKPVEAKADGKLHTGDAYLILSTRSLAGGVLQHGIHFWIGKECSQDEAAGAAMLAVELDNALSDEGKEASISRHTQGAEAAAFISCFHSGVTYIPGGVASGLSSSADTSNPELHKLSGTRQFRACQVPTTGKSLTTADGFALDLRGVGNTVIQWVGAGAGLQLKFKLFEYAKQLSDCNHAGSAEVVILEQGETEGPAAASFYSTLGIKDPVNFKPAAAAQASHPGPPQTWAVQYVLQGVEKPMGFPLQVEGGTDREHSFEMRKMAVASRKIQPVPEALTASMLTADAMILVHASNTIYAWLGKHLPEELRSTALSMVDKLRFQNDLPADAGVALIKQGLESPDFQSLFPDWQEAQAAALGELKALKAADSATSGSSASSRAVDVAAMAATAQLPEAAVDDGSASKQVWRVEKFEAVELAAHEYGTFSSGDCYIVLCTYGPKKSDYMMYMWQGAQSTQDERGACSLSAAKLDEELCNGSAVQVRIVEGKEPAHFVMLWAGKMVVYEGGGPSGFSTVQQEDAKVGGESSDLAVRLFHVRSESSAPPRAIQVPAKATALNSGDAFIAVTPELAFVWSGSSCRPAEVAAARTVLDTITAGAAPRTMVAVKEGDEPDKFWEALSGKGAYARFAPVVTRQPARLFVLGDAVTGGLGVASEEVPNYAQSDLGSGDVMLLDTGASIFVWLGAAASEYEKSEAPMVAAKYLEAGKRDPDTAVAIVKEGAEPPMFTAHFLPWRADQRNLTAADYEANVAAMKASQTRVPATVNGKYEAKATTPTASPVRSPVTPVNAGPEAQAKVAAVKPPGSPAAVNGGTKHDDHNAPIKTAGTSPVTAAVAAADNNNSSSSGKALSPPTTVPSKPPATVPSKPPPPVTALPAKYLTPQTQRGGSIEPVTADPSGTKGVVVQVSPGSKTFETATLKKMKGSDGIDPTVKEKYLSGDDFQELFGMNKDAFAAMPLWRRQQVKKKVGLF